MPDENGNLGLFRVGKVLEAEKHPNADRLQLCRVDVGEGEPRQIVCGAWNFGAGATVAVALPGATLPGGLQLEQRKVRGELSDGMILAEDEIDLGTDHSGIMLLPETEPGTPLGDVLPLAEEVLLVESTGNRPDLLSIYGIAREVAALYEPRARAAARHRSRSRPADEPVDVTVDDLEGCPRYIGRLFRNVQVGQSPVWLKARLLAAGMRPISNVVDATNYVMLALGNPLHAFDLRTLAGGKIIVRRARPGEAITDARRRRPQARGERPRDRRRRAGGRDRRDHGRRGDRDRRVDDRRPARGRELRADRDLPHVGATPAAHRGLEPLGEGRRPVPRRPGGEARDAADRRDGRRRVGRATSTCRATCRSGP